MPFRSVAKSQDEESNQCEAPLEVREPTTCVRSSFSSSEKFLICLVAPEGNVTAAAMEKREI
jgi:hypothetical protein